MTLTIIYDHLYNASSVERVTFWPPDKANAWDGTWHSVGEGCFIRYVKTAWGGGYFEQAVPSAGKMPELG